MAGSGTDPAGVLTNDDIADPVQPILDLRLPTQERPETYTWRLCVVMRGSDPQRVQPELEIDASNGGSFTVDGTIRLCQGSVVVGAAQNSKRKSR